MAEGREIPKEFYSFESKQLFTHCIECEKYLLDEGTEYFIEVAVRNYHGYTAKDTVFDYAICLDCLDRMRKEISTGSMVAIMQYFQQNMQEMPNLERCMVKGMEPKDCDEYQLYAHCRGVELKEGEQPYMLSGAAIEELIPKLSKKTREEMEGFMNEHFSPDPSLMEPTPPMILI